MSKKEIILLLIFLVTFGYFFQPGDDNISSHLFPIFSLIDYGTLNIDQFHTQTNDKSFYKGHYYSDKAPGLFISGVPIYLTFKFIMQVTGGEYIYPRAKYIITFLVISLPSALMGIFIFRLLGFFIKKEFTTIFLTFIYFLGTLAFPYSTIFYGHQLSASLLFIGFYLVFILFRYPSQNVNKMLFASGFMIGFAVITDFPSFIIAFLVFLYILGYLKEKFKTLYLQKNLLGFNKKITIFLKFYFKEGLGPFLLGGSIPLLFLFIYNALCFENIFSLGYNYLIGGCAHKMGEGFMGITFPTLKRLYGITISPYRGLFFTSPVLLLAIPGFYYFYQMKEFRKEFYLCLLSSIGFLIFNASYAFWWGGEVIGPRHLVNALPFMLIPLGICLQKIRKISIFLGILSVLIISIITVTSPQLPSNIKNPFFQYSLPQFIKGNIVANCGNAFGLSGISSLLPWVMLITSLFGLCCLTKEG